MGCYLKSARLDNYFWAPISNRVEYLGPDGGRRLCLSLTCSALNDPKLSSARGPRKEAISSLFLPDRARAIVMCGLKGRVCRLNPACSCSFSVCSYISSTWLQASPT